MSPGARFSLRAVLAGVAAAQASLLTVVLANDSLTSQDGIVAFLLAVGAALAYAGIGASVPQVEPRIGNELPEDDLEFEVLPELDEADHEGGPES